MKKIFTLIAITIVIACSPKIRTNVATTRPALAEDAEVVVLGVEKQTPASALDIGSIKIGDTGFSTNCSWETVVEKAKEEARRAGGNIVKITRHTPPNLGSTCHRIEAKILLMEDVKALADIVAGAEEVIDSTWNFAKLYVYRPTGPGLLIAYNLHLGDSVIARVQNNFAEKIMITKKGLNALWARTESRAEVPIDIEYGRTYYLKCTVNMGIMAGRPNLELVDPTTGRAEYDAIRKRKQKREEKSDK